jgi:uncharacterized repeat protein (TIGR03803 family)
MIFKITPTGTFTMLHSGGAFAAGLTPGNDGNFYGTSWGGYGWVFKMTPSGMLTTLFSFGPLPSGRYPGGLVQAFDGNFYGTTAEGGTNGGGTLFRITPGGALITLYNFCSQSGCADGAGPGPLIQGADGNLYGISEVGGTGPCSEWCGTIFKITTNGTLTTLHSFDLTDGGGPRGLVQASDGNFYGTTYSGGLSNSNCDSGTCGTVFKMTPTGPATVADTHIGDRGTARAFLHNAVLIGESRDTDRLGGFEEGGSDGAWIGRRLNADLAAAARCSASGAPCQSSIRR